VRLFEKFSHFESKEREKKICNEGTSFGLVSGLSGQTFLHL